MWQYYCLTRALTFSMNRLGIAETGSKPSSELAARMLVNGCPPSIFLVRRSGAHNSTIKRFRCTYISMTNNEVHILGPDTQKLRTKEHLGQVSPT